MPRLLLLALVTLLAAPGTWLRTPLPPPDYRDQLQFRPLAMSQSRLGLFTVEGAWVVASPHAHFGSYSALVSLGDGTLLAGTDRGRLLRFAPPGADSELVEFPSPQGAETEPKKYRDLESLTRDPDTGTVWAGYEASNSIAKLDAKWREERRVHPEAMSEWSSNSGAESLVRLADGSFLVMAEGRPGKGDGTVPAVLFPGDPTDGVEPIAFSYAPPRGFRPVDAAALPDGRVLILLRTVHWGLPPRFAGRIAVADPRLIAEGRVWRSRVLARLEAPLPVDNYEGLALERSDDGGVRAWLISDDNDSAFQRTLLLKLSLPDDL